MAVKIIPTSELRQKVTAPRAEALGSSHPSFQHRHLLDISLCADKGG